VLILTREEGCMPCKITTLTLTFCTQAGQEITTTLVPVFTDQGTTVGRVFL